MTMKDTINRNARKTAKVILVACVVVWVYQIVSLAKLKREIELSEHQLVAAQEEITHWENQGKSIKAEIDEKNSWAGVLGAFSESFMNGFTFGLFDDEGMFGASRRYERWEAETRKRIVEVETGYKTATDKLETAKNRHLESSNSLQKKVTSRNISGIVAIAAILFLVYFPKSKINPQTV